MSLREGRCFFSHPLFSKATWGLMARFSKEGLPSLGEAVSQ